MMMKSKHLFATLAVTACLSAPAAAQQAPSAQPSTAPAPPAAAPSGTAAAESDEGKARFFRGVDLFRENDFRAALVEFKRSYEISHNYKVLYNIGQTEYELADYASALRSFQRYLDLGGADIEAARRGEVEKEIQGLAARVARVEIKSNTEGAEVLIDDVVVGKTPLTDAVVVSIGRRKVVIQKDGLTSTARFVDLAGGDRTSIEVNLSGPAVSKEDASPPRTGMWVSLAVTGGLAVGAAVVGGLALSAHADAKKQLDTFGATKADIDAARSKTQTLALVTDVLGGAAIAMAGVTIVLGVTGGKKEAPPQPKAALTVGPSGFSLSGKF
ncbi:MAG: PEGA domain-containing protein [Polyangiaceae bacterium]